MNLIPEFMTLRTVVIAAVLAISLVAGGIYIKNYGFTSKTHTPQVFDVYTIKNNYSNAVDTLLVVGMRPDGVKCKVMIKWDPSRQTYEIPVESLTENAEFLKSLAEDAKELNR